MEIFSKLKKIIVFLFTLRLKSSFVQKIMPLILLSIIIYFYSFLSNSALAETITTEEGDALSDFLCQVVAYITSGPGKAVAVLTVVSLGFGLFFGKTNWNVSVSTLIGIGLIFGGSNIVEMIIYGKVDETTKICIVVEDEDSGSDGEADGEEDGSGEGSGSSAGSTSNNEDQSSLLDCDSYAEKECNGVMNQACQEGFKEYSENEKGCGIPIVTCADFCKDSTEIETCKRTYELSTGQTCSLPDPNANSNSSNSE